MSFGGEWFALQVRPRWEKMVAAALLRKDYEHFLPVYKCRRKQLDVVREVQAPLFPGYVFCRLDLRCGPRVVTTPGVVRIVGFGNTPTPVPESEISALQQTVESGLLIEPHRYLHVGQRVRLLQGPLSGLEGILVRIKNGHRLVVSVTLLQRSVAVELDAYPGDLSVPADSPAAQYELATSDFLRRRSG